MDIKTLGSIAGLLLGGIGISTLFERPKAHENPVLLRPPGAGNEKEFLSKCIRCGLCLQNCPPQVIRTAPQSYGSEVGTPYIDAKSAACILCEDFPCVEACPTGALNDIEKVEDVEMGIAVLDRDHCITLEGNRCEVCYRACPLIDEAITLELQVRPNDDIHTIFEPVINPDKCVGCGICEERCVVREPAVAIRVKPQSIVGMY